MRAPWSSILLLAASACAPAPKAEPEPADPDTATAPDGPPDSGPTDTDTGVPAWPDPDLEVEVEPGPTVTCAAPEERSTLGAFVLVEDLDGLGSFEHFDGGLPGATMSVAVGDVDADGHLDLLYGRPDGVRLMMGTGDGRFTHAPDGAWPTPPDDTRIVSGSLLLDLDADGDLDALVSHRTHALARYVNRGDGHFDAHWDLGDAPLTTGHIGLSAGDIDGDGTLDVLVGGHQASGPIDGEFPPPLPAARYTLVDGQLAVHPDALPERASDGYTFVTSIVDLDDDHRPDAYFANDHGAFAPGNAALWGSGTAPDRTLAPSTEDLGIEPAMAAMGVGVGDLNADGRPDLAVSNWGAPALFLSDPDFGWVDAALARGVRDTPEASVGWGTDLGDFDNDGDLDLYMTFGFLPGATDAARTNEPRQPDKFFENDGTGTFTDIAAWLGVDDVYVGRTAMLVDLDHNGFLDLLLARQFRPPKVWLARCDARAWLGVQLHQPGENPHAIGAKIQVESAAGTQTRWVQAGGRSFGASHPHHAHFGLGLSEDPVRVVVTWPDGHVSETTDLPPRQTTLLRRTHLE